MTRNHDASSISKAGSRERRRRRKETLSQTRANKVLRRNLSIRNFRPLGGFGASQKVYRCASTDVLGARIRHESSNSCSIWTTSNVPSQLQQPPSEADALVRNDAGLVIDLRSAPERREDDAWLWIREASGFASSTNSTSNFSNNERKRPIRIVTIPLEGTTEDAKSNSSILQDTIFGGNNRNVTNVRYVVRLDILNRSELLVYVRKEWLGLSPQKRAHSSTDEIMKELNKRGLAGLNEAILENKCGQKGMCLALQLMTLYREATDNNINDLKANDPCNNASIVFHCVQGKDRTGMLAMLMQILMGCSDETIVDDYYRSNAELTRDKTFAASSSLKEEKHESPSAAAAVVLANTSNKTSSNNFPSRTRMDPSVFRGTNRAAMVSTLKELRRRHGKSLQGYFDAIGFDSIWRKRFVEAFGGANERRSRL